MVGREQASEFDNTFHHSPVRRAHGSSPFPRPILLLLGLMILVAPFLAACGETSTNLPSDEEGHALHLDVVDASPVVGDTLEVRARYADSNGEPVRELSASEVEWSSSDSRILQVESGAIIAREAGEATLEATAQNGVSASVAITVRALPPSRVQVVGGDRQDVRAGVEAPDSLVVRVTNRLDEPVAGQKVEFSVASDAEAVDPPAVPTDPQGKAATAWTPGGDTGTREIKALVGDLEPGVFEATVRPGLADTAVVSPDSATIEEGEMLELALSAEDRYGNELGETASPHWASDDSATVAVTRGGVVEGKNAGTAVVTATVDEIQVESFIRVVTRVASVQAHPSEIRLTALDETRALEGAAYDREGNEVHDTALEWSSVDPEVVAVDSHGTIVANAPGASVVVLHAPCCDLADTVDVQVEPAPKSAELSPSSVTLEPEESRTLTASAYDANGYPISDASPDSWAVEHDEVATVDEGGTVTALSAGSTTVSVSFGSEVSASASLTVEDPAPPASNLPLFAEGPHDREPGTGQEGWKGTWRAPSFNHATVKSDAAAPPPFDHFIRTRYPDGMRDGVGPVHWYGWDADGIFTGFREVRIQKWMRIGGDRDDFESHPVGTKMGFMGAGACDGVRAELYPLLEGGLRSSFTVRIIQQFLDRKYMTQNVTGDRVVEAGRWQKWEYHMVLNDLGKENGVMRLTVDGEPIIDYDDVKYRDHENPCGLQVWRWNPTWGGNSGAVKSRDDFIDIAEVKMWGERL